MNTNFLGSVWNRKRNPKIFITYRRSGEGQGYGGRLADRLIEYFGAHQCFRDIENIETGADFVESITLAVGVCEVLIVVIGPDWTTQKDKDGRPRLQNPNDFVRLEVAAALRRNIRVIPALVGGAHVPSEDELPDDLKSLTRRQAHEVTDSRWDYDVNRLLEQIKLAGIKGRSPAERAAFQHRAKVGAAVTVTAAVAILGTILWNNVPPANAEKPPVTITGTTVAPQKSDEIHAAAESLKQRAEEAIRAAERAEQARLDEKRAREAEQQRARDAEQRAEQARLAERRAREDQQRAEQARLEEQQRAREAEQRRVRTAEPRSKESAQRVEQTGREPSHPKLRGLTGSVLVKWWHDGILYASLLQMYGAVGNATVTYTSPLGGLATVRHDLRFSDVGARDFDYMLIGANPSAPYAPDSFALVEASGRVTVRNTCDLAGECAALASVSGSFAHVH